MRFVRPEMTESLLTDQVGLHSPVVQDPGFLTGWAGQLEDWVGLIVDSTDDPALAFFLSPVTCLRLGMLHLTGPELRDTAQGCKEQTSLAPEQSLRMRS